MVLLFFISLSDKTKTVLVLPKSVFVATKTEIVPPKHTFLPHEGRYLIFYM